MKSNLPATATVLSVGSKSEITSRIDDDKEYIISARTPALASDYSVIYDGNAPDGCSVSNIPANKRYAVYETVEISDNEPKCSGYYFKKWDISTKGVVKANDDYFIMPEEDVVIRAIWTKLSISKAMDGKVEEYVPSTLEQYRYSSTYGLHKYKDSITDIIFQDSMSSIGGAIEVLDISAEKNNGILAYIVPNKDDNTKYTVYIQGDGSIIANSYSSYLFYKFSNLKSIQNLALLDTSEVVNMNYMFNGCSSLTSLDLSNFDTAKVSYMDEMFRECSGLTSLNLSSFNTSKVIGMDYMFRGCSGLTSLNLSSFNTSNVTDMDYMFNGCSSLTSLDLSNFDTAKVSYMDEMFNGCSSLISLNLSSFNTSKVTGMDYMFYGCSSLTSLDLSSFNTSNVTDVYNMFGECSGLISLDLSSFNTSSVKKMGHMFYKCSKLTSLNIGNFETSNVMDMNFMFSDCSSLTSLDLSSFDVSKVTDMSSMFYKCSGLTSLNLSNFYTSSAVRMSSMFNKCSSLTSLVLSNFDTSKVTVMTSMFNNCSSLTSLNLSSFDTSNVESMGYMFYKCSSLTSLNLSSFDTSNVESMEYMFYYCSSLTTTLKIMNKLSKYNSMFTGAASSTNSKITVDYIEAVADVIDTYIATKSYNSKVVKGTKLPEYMITVSGNTDIVSNSATAYAGKIVELNSTSGNFKVLSFKMNGALITGNKFKMPASNVSITNIIVVEAFTIESEHNPYPDSLNDKIYGEKTFNDATSLTVELDYQTQSTSFDYIYLYDSTGKQYGKYGGSTRKIELITIPGNYIKITFRTNSYSNNYYGFKAIVTPNY